MSFPQGNPAVSHVISTANCLVFGNTSSGNALSVQQLGAGNVVSFSNASGGSNVFVMNNLGRVGVGIGTPLAPLEVYGSLMVGRANSSALSAVPSGNGGVAIGWNRGGANQNGATFFGNGQGGGAGGWEFITYNVSGNLGANAAFISSVGGLTLGTYSNVSVAPAGGIICPGNVGIGTAAVSAGLQFWGGASSTTTNGAPGTGGVIIGSDATNGVVGDLSPVLHFRQSWYTQGSGSVTTGGIAGYKTQGSGSFGGGLAFLYCGNGATSLTQGMTLTDLGRIGIGTVSPANSLQVAGSTAATISVGGPAGWSNVLQLGNLSYNQYGSVSAYPANRFTIITAGLPGVNDVQNANGGLYVAGQGLRLTGQRVTWASTSYESVIEIDGGRSALAGVNNGQIRFYTANTQRAVIDEIGNVGIGTASPSSNVAVDTVGIVRGTKGVATNCGSVANLGTGGSVIHTFSPSPGGGHALLTASGPGSQPTPYLFGFVRWIGNLGQASLTVISNSGITATIDVNNTQITLATTSGTLSRVVWNITYLPTPNYLGDYFF